MKLIIQIPCYNEEQTLPITLKDLPREISGIDEIEVLIIDDGSSDRTVDVATAYGIKHIVRFKSNQGLARAFAAGIDASLKLGADIIVNTDADNQYKGADIAKLIQPILQKKADIVVGCRNIKSIRHFSPIKKFFQYIGSFVVRTISNTSLPDATSGFRAYSREAALRLHVFSDFSYTLETIIQAGLTGLSIEHVPIETNDKLRESRLFSSIGEYIIKSLSTIIRIYAMYKPLKVLTLIAVVFFIPGIILILRFFYFYFTLAHVQTGHIQSLIIASVLIIVGFQVLMFGLVADITAKNRMLLEDILLRIKRGELEKKENTFDNL